MPSFSIIIPLNIRKYVRLGLGFVFKSAILHQLGFKATKTRLPKSIVISIVGPAHTLDELSKKETAAYFNARIRAHASIANQLHGPLDVSFGEDKRRTRMANGAEKHHTLRKMALQLLQ